MEKSLKKKKKKRKFCRVSGDEGLQEFGCCCGCDLVQFLKGGTATGACSWKSRRAKRFESIKFKCGEINNLR